MLQYNYYFTYFMQLQPVVKVSISLADCLACAGCVTSAETVLIEEQSVQRAIEGLRGSVADEWVGCCWCDYGTKRKC